MVKDNYFLYREVKVALQRLKAKNMKKADILVACKKVIESRIMHTQEAIDSARESANSEQKSTAGDKHDTARAIAQFEQEKLSKQLAEQLKLRDALFLLSDQAASDIVRIGSLVECSNGLFFVGIGLGKIEVGGDHVFCISKGSPLGIAILKKSEKELFTVNGREFEILSIL
jgi:transcription elongation GreA/GreB family factor